MRFLDFLPLALLSTLSTASDPRLLERAVEKRDQCGAEALDRWPSSRLTVINATPYRWHRIRVGSCQTRGWNTDTTPGVLNAGTSTTIEYTLTRGNDAAADLAFALEIDNVVTTKRFNIHVQAKPNVDGYVITGEVMGGLSTRGHGSDQGTFPFGDYTKVDGGTSLLGADLFVLSGDEKFGFDTIAPPAAWMASQGDALKNLNFAQLVMPASHDSGTSRIEGRGGVEGNTLTQQGTIYQQLFRGARVFDIRPYFDEGPNMFRCGHFSGSSGAFGQSLGEVIDDVNRFRKDYPGELIILDLDSFEFKTRRGAEMYPFDDPLYERLLREFETGINGLTTTYELTKHQGPGRLAGEPIKTFYKNNPSPVFVRLPAGKWKGRIPPIVSGNKINGIVMSDFFPIDSKWSNMNFPDALASDQRELLKNRDANKPFMSALILTLQDLQNVGLSGDTIRSLATDARAITCAQVFQWSVDLKKYPNMIQSDFILNNQFAALSTALNYWFSFKK